MFCRRCGTEINSNYTNLDGTVECPECGAIYRVKTSRPSASPRREPQPTRPASYTRSPNARSRSAAQQKRHPAKAGIPKWFLGIAAICIIAVVISIITANSNPYTEQYKVIEKMERAMNNRSMTELLECFDPSYSETMLEMIDMMGYDADEFIGEIIDAVTGGAYESLSGLKIKITPTSCSVNGDTATVNVRMNATIPGRGSQAAENAFNLTKINSNWYLDMD